MSAEPEKLGVIYNPKAGTRKVQKRWKEIKEYMDSKGVPEVMYPWTDFGYVVYIARFKYFIKPVSCTYTCQ